MFCKDCGAQNPDDAKYCLRCGEKLTFLTDELSYHSHASIKEVKSSYNRGVRALSFIVGALTLTGDLFNGWPYYFESEIPLVLICEILLTLMGILLILLGAFPDYMNKRFNHWIDIENKYIVIVAITILLVFMIVGFEPEPSVGWWNYNATW